MDLDRDVAELYPAALRYALALTGSRAGAEDLLHEALIRLLGRARRATIDNPAGVDGAQHLPGSTVTVAVSDGSLMVVPDLVRLTPEEALISLTVAGWSGDDSGMVRTTVQSSDQALWGRVVTQRPAAGTTMSKNAAVAITVAVEPRIPMPGLTGKTIPQVQAILAAAGWIGTLTVKVHQEVTPPAGRSAQVFGQSPPPADLILVTAPITIDVYRAG